MLSSDAEKTFHVLITSRLAYCSVLLVVCNAMSLNKLQLVLNAAARMLTGSQEVPPHHNTIYTFVSLT